MKPFSIGAAIAMATITSAHAETTFVGNAFIDNVSGPTSCTSTFAIGDFGRVLFRPRGTIFGNGGNSNLVYLSSRSAVEMYIPNGDFQAPANYGSQSEGSTGKIGSGSGAVTQWAQDPPTLGSGTQTIKVVAKFSNFFRISQCFVTLRVNLIRR